MDNVKKKLKISIILLVLLIPTVFAITIREGSCNSDESCLFSMFQKNDSHIARCDYYNYSFCYIPGKSVMLRDGICNLGESCILSQFQPNNSHAAQCNYFNYSLCINGNWTVDLTDASCSIGEPLFSLYQENNTHVANLSYYNYTLCLRENPGVTGEPSSGGVSARSEEEAYECIKHEDCGEEFYCYDHQCVKLFDIKILKVDSPLRPEGFFSFSYYIKGMAEFNNDIIIDFWLEKDGEKITSGADTLYLGSFEEKTEDAELYLPKDTVDGVYNFYIEASFENYRARSFRVIEIKGREIILRPEKKSYLIYYILLGILLVLLVLVYLVIHLIRKIKSVKKKD